MPAALEDTEARGVLDERAQLLGPAGEDLLHPPLADDRAAEPELGEELDHIRPPYGGAVHEVLPLAAAVQPAGDRERREVEPADALRVLELELDLAEGGRNALARAAEEHVVRLLGAELGRAQAPGRPDDRVGDVRLPGAVRPDEDRDPGLEPKLDRIGKALEAAQAETCEVHARSLPVGPDARHRLRCRHQVGRAPPARPSEMTGRSLAVYRADRTLHVPTGAPVGDSHVTVTGLAVS